MKIRALAILLVPAILLGSSAAQDQPAGDAVKKELKKLQGVWEMAA